MLTDWIENIINEKNPRALPGTLNIIPFQGKLWNCRQ